MQQALEDEVTEFLGRERYQRADGDGGAVYRNGYEPRTVKTTSGSMELERPRIRSVSELEFESQVLGKGVARTHALEALVILGFLRGLSVSRPSWRRPSMSRSSASQRSRGSARTPASAIARGASAGSQTTTSSTATWT
jgi:transposase-like protein